MNNYMGRLKDLSMTDSVERITEVFLNTAEKVNELIEEIYGDEKITFPINIQKIASKMEICISKETLNPEGINRFSRVLGRIITMQGKTRIVVDSCVSYKTQRYAMAHAIGRFLLNKDDAIFESSYAIPLIPQSLEEIAADSVALFLLLPTNVFKEEFASYLDRCKDCPLDVDEWLQYLSDTSQVSLFNLAIGYQQLKQVLCYQRQQEFVKSDFDFDKMKNDKFRIIFA